MWPLIILFLVVCYWIGKRSQSAKGTGRAQSAKQGRQASDPYDAQTERLYQAAVKELNWYRKMKIPQTDSVQTYLRNSNSLQDKIVLQKLKKTDKNTLNALRKNVDAALQELERHRGMDAASKGKYIRQYMDGPLRLSIKMLAGQLNHSTGGAMRSAAYSAPSYTYSTPSSTYSTPSYTSPSPGFDGSPVQMREKLFQERQEQERARAERERVERERAEKEKMRQMEMHQLEERVKYQTRQGFILDPKEVNRQFQEIDNRY